MRAPAITVLLLALPASAVDVVCLGDSITQGNSTEVSTPWPAVMQGILGAGYVVVNEGVSGDGVLELKSRYCAACVARSPDIAVFSIGTNNIGGALTHSAIFTHAKEMMNDACQRGFRVIVIDVMPRDFPGASETARDALNALYKDWAQTSHPASCSAAWVDMSAILDVDDNGAFDAAYRNSLELTHPNQNGMNAIAAAVAVAVQP